MTYTPEQHKSLTFAAEQIAKARKEWGAPHSYIEALSENRSYRMDDDAKDFKRGLENHSSSLRRAFEDHIENLCRHIRNTRKVRNEREAYNPIGRIGGIGVAYAARALDYVYQRTRTQVDLCKPSDNRKVGVENDGGSYFEKVYVTIGIGWKKLVHDRGLAIINSSAGLRFLLTAKPRTFSHIDDDMTRVFEVKVVGIKSKKGFVEDGWLLVHGQSSGDVPVYDYKQDGKVDATNNVHAFHRSLGDCKKLFDRRVKAHILKELENV